MKIYTKKGDGGSTALIGGTRVPKFDLRIEAYGTIDELNAYLGWIGDQEDTKEHLVIIRHIQDRLFVIGSILANDPVKSHFKLPELKEEDVELLEKSIDHMNESLPPLTQFVLPGGHPSNAMTHVARCVCRRAERRVVELNERAPVPPVILRFLNRLSDWLFVLSRHLSHEAEVPEILWNA